MTKSAKLFWISFGVYSLILLLGAITIERNAYNLNFLFKAKEYISLLKYFTFIGLAFVVVAFISAWRKNFSHKRAIKRLEDQKTELKATLFDLKKRGEEPPPNLETDSPKPMK